MSNISIPVTRLAPSPASALNLTMLDRLLAPTMFCLAAVFLSLAAGVIHRLGHIDMTALEADLFFWGLVLLWPLFILEGLLRFVVCRRPAATQRQRLLAFLGICLFPPFRMGGRTYADAGALWLPGLG